MPLGFVLYATLTCSYFFKRESKEWMCVRVCVSVCVCVFVCEWEREYYTYFDQEILFCLLSDACLRKKDWEKVNNFLLQVGSNLTLFKWYFHLHWNLLTPYKHYIAPVALIIRDKLFEVLIGNLIPNFFHAIFGRTIAQWAKSWNIVHLSKNITFCFSPQKLLYDTNLYIIC